MERTKHQKFDYREVPRSQIKQAPYNPNKMEEETFAALRKKVKDVGVVDTLIWNEKTGNLVGGHHRLKALDVLEGNQDYLVGVAVVQLTPKREREMNIFLNNPQAQGNFDKDRLFRMLQSEPTLDIADLGFTKLDLESEFGELPELNLASLDEKKSAPAKPPVSVPAAQPPSPAPAAAVAAQPETATPEASASAGTTQTTPPSPARPPLPSFDDPEEEDDGSEEDEDDQQDEDDLNGADEAAAPVHQSPTFFRPVPPAAAGGEAPLPPAAAKAPSSVEAALQGDGDAFLLITFDNADEKITFLQSKRFPMDVEYLTPAELGLRY